MIDKIEVLRKSAAFNTFQIKVPMGSSYKLERQYTEKYEVATRFKKPK